MGTDDGGHGHNDTATENPVSQAGWLLSRDQNPYTKLIMPTAQLTADTSADQHRLAGFRLDHHAGTAGHHHMTAILTTTSSTMLHADTTRRTRHAHLACSDPGLACTC